MKKYTFDAVDVPDELITGPLKKVDPLVLKILYNRGYRTTTELTNMLFGRLEQSLKETKMQDTDKALPLLKKAVKNKELIVVYQDYDVDGCSAGAICLECIRNLGGKIVGYVNDRETDGYGICKNGVDEIGRLHPECRMIMTVDNGIVANEAIAYAKSKGYTVILTDHHLPSETLPPADAVIDPHRADEFYSFADLCGAGVAFKLMLALYDYMGRDRAPVLKTMDIVGLATVADVVPLIGENRDLVREGLNMMNADDPRPAFRVMKALCEVDEVNAHYTIGFQFAPMINAMSRMGEDPYIATEVLISKDEGFLNDNIGFMIKTNKERKRETDLEEELANIIFNNEQIALHGQMTPKEFEENLPSSVILASEKFDEGIIGIVAGRFKTKYNRPAIIFAHNGEDTLKASARGIDGFHLKEALDQIPGELMIGYGGHAKAAGLSIKKENFDAFKKEFLKISDKLPKELFVEERKIDEVLDADHVTVRLVQELRMLEPYGEGNRPPRFGLRYSPDKTRYFGENDKHLKYWIRSSNLNIIEWSGAAADQDRVARNKTRNKVVGRLELNHFNGMISPQFIVEK